ncbi:MAG: hypothetical protein SPH90_00595 [Candidatus Alectryocaccobium sp.]|nr:hypothetical protein [Candidatus Alectryocaccobium sp.]
MNGMTAGRRVVSTAARISQHPNIEQSDIKDEENKYISIKG